jgi:hypothetical protein
MTSLLRTVALFRNSGLAVFRREQVSFRKNDWKMLETAKLRSSSVYVREMLKRGLSRVSFLYPVRSPNSAVFQPLT